MKTQAWSCVGASVIGTSHLRTKRPCQDAHGWAELPNGVLVAAVADGAGSAARSQEGARCAVDACRDFLAARLGESAPQCMEAANALLRECVAHAEEKLRTLDGDFQEFATTLTVLFVAHEWLGMAQVGDGSAVCRLGVDNLQVLTVPEHGEYINETTFLTSRGYADRLHVAAIPAKDVSGIAMMTDGVQILAIQMSDNSAHPPFFRSLFEFAAEPSASETELAEFLASDRVIEKTDDDKTLLIAVRNDIQRPAT